jgi:hypothetical protein
LIRVQISEGPFLSMAELASTFSIGRDPVSTWVHGGSPSTLRNMAVWYPFRW